jgi:hypothetical protein
MRAEMGHGPAMNAERRMSNAFRTSLSVGLACLAIAACSSQSASTSAPDAGYCESNGYSPAENGTCVKGTCLASGTEEPCCGSLCASCEAKGLVSYTEAGACPPGLCPSADVTAALQCCDSVPSVLPDGAYCEPAVSDSGAAETSAPEAAVESGVPEASGD